MTRFMGLEDLLRSMVWDRVDWSARVQVGVEGFPWVMCGGAGGVRWVCECYIGYGFVWLGVEGSLGIWEGSVGGSDLSRVLNS